MNAIRSLAFYMILGLACASNLLTGNTPVDTVIYSKEGNYEIVSGGVGLGGTDVATCSPLQTRTLTLPWGFPATATVDRAFVLFQIASNSDADTLNFQMKVNNQVISGRNFTSGKACNKLTGTKTYLKNSWAFYASVSSLVRGAAAGKTDATLDFHIRFSTNCNTLTSANGASLIVIVKDASIPYSKAEVRAGAFAFDNKFSSADNNPVTGVFSTIFDIPVVGLSEGQRTDDSVEQFTTVLGEGEDFGAQEDATKKQLAEGFFINGKNVTQAFDGLDGKRWDTLKINLNPWIADDATKVNFTVISPIDCLIFVAVGLQYQLVEPNSTAQVVEDPHMRTWDGAHVTLRLEGDFVAAESAETGLALHGRFCKGSRGPWAPWTCAVAMRCGLDQGFVVVSADDFAVSAYGWTEATIVDVSPSSKVVSCAGLQVEMTRHRFHRHSYINARFIRTASAPSDLRGLLGAPNRNVYDDFMFRDGTMFVPEAYKSHFIGHAKDELVRLQESWRVQSHERMFPTEFVSAKQLSSDVFPTAADKKIPHKVAEKACLDAGIKSNLYRAMCVHDVVLTGSFAGVANLVKFLSS